MDLYLVGSNRNNNCYKILSDLKNKKDMLISLKGINIKHCLGCMACSNKLENYCIQVDDMKKIYDSILLADKIIIASPIYFNQVSGILKTVIDRLNPFSIHELLKGKKIYLITIGSMLEEENKEVVDNIKNYFNELAEIFCFEFIYLSNLTSNLEDKVNLNYENYNQIIQNIKNKIK